MPIYAVMRHAKAPMGSLSEEGREDALRYAEFLAQYLGNGPTIIASSPTERTMQSAEIIREVTKGEVRQTPEIGEKFDGSSLAKGWWALEALSNGFHMVLVTHDPNVGFLLRLVCHVRQAAPIARTQMPYGIHVLNFISHSNYRYAFTGNH